MNAREGCISAFPFLLWNVSIITSVWQSIFFPPSLTAPLGQPPPPQIQSHHLSSAIHAASGQPLPLEPPAGRFLNQGTGTPLVLIRNSIEARHRQNPPRLCVWLVMWSNPKKSYMFSRFPPKKKFVMQWFYFLRFCDTSSSELRLIIS